MEYEVHYRDRKGQPLVRILSQTNPVDIFRPYYPKIPSNIILPSTPRSYEMYLPFRFLTKFLYAFLTSHLRATFPCPYLFPWLHDRGNTL
jgi:hypothetical protein